MAKISGEYLVVIFILLLSSCSSRKIQRHGDESLVVYVNEIYSWVNLMPGSESRFHITGDIEILVSKNYDFNFVNLISLIVYQNNKEIYRISPVIQEDDITERPYKNIKFSTIRGLLLNRELNIDQRISLGMIFNEGSNEIIYILDNVKINKAY